MRIARTIIAFAVILSLCASTFPWGIPGDVNRDRSVDLADAILAVNALSQTGGDASSFAAGMKDALQAFHVASELDKTIKTDSRHCSITTVMTCFAVPVLLTISPVPSVTPFAGSGACFLYQSNIAAPMPPPPRSV